MFLRARCVFPGADVAVVAGRKSCPRVPVPSEQMGTFELFVLAVPGGFGTVQPWQGACPGVSLHQHGSSASFSSCSAVI